MVQDVAASLASEHADLSGLLRHNETQRRSTAVEMATAERHHLRITSTFGAGSRQPPPARATTRSAAPAASVSFSASTASQWRHTAASAPLQHQAPATSAGSTAPPAATERPRAVHHRRPVVNCCCALPPAASTNPPRRPLLGPSPIPQTRSTSCVKSPRSSHFPS